MRRSPGKASVLAVATAMAVGSAAWCQRPIIEPGGSAWQNPLQFEIGNTGMGWAITGAIQGHAISDGHTLVISVEQGHLYRPKTFVEPQEIRKIMVGVIRREAPGQPPKFVLWGDPHPLNRILNPDETMELDPFEVRIRIDNYPMLKGDTLAFSVETPTTYQGKTVVGTVAAYGLVPLPVNQVAAYCADLVEEFKKPGNVLVQARHICHDSAGRVRTEMRFYRSAEEAAANPTKAPRSIEIRDPVANLTYLLDPGKKQALRSKGSADRKGVIGGILGGLPGSQTLKPVKSEKWLGARQINGVEADGKSITTVYPAGYQRQSEEITSTEENWYSYRIQLLVRRITAHPRNGDYEYQAKNIEVGEPDAGLFKVPADYSVEERQ